MRATPGVEVATEARYSRTIEVDGVRGHVTVTPSRRPNRLDIAIRVPRVTAIPSIIARLRRLFDLDAEPQTIARHLSEDPALSPLVHRRPGLRVPGAWDPFELAVRAILGQQISVAAATQLAGRLVAAFGKRYDARERPQGLTHLFPSAKRLRDVDVAVIGMPKARAGAISSLAVAALTDPWLFDSGQDLGSAVQRLRAVPGIGEWTAQYIAMRALHAPDGFPAADLGLQRALAIDHERPTPGQLLARAEAWRPWRAYAALHLWSAGSETRREKQS
jgi:AraC family transcriptional regulator of adaptative response / DNA-3-methyladenine glycosylase II